MKKNQNEKITKTVLLTVVFALLTAFVGTFFVLSFFTPSSFFTEKLGIDNQNQEFLKTSLGIKAYGRLEVFEFLDKGLPAVATIYKKKVDSFSLIDRAYLDVDRVGFGFVLTSDGWLITNSKALGGYSLSRLKILVGDKLYNVVDKVNGKWTDVVFIKIDAQNLPVASLGDSDSLSLGDVVFTGTDKNNFWFSYVNGINVYKDTIKKGDIILSSEEYGKVIKLQDDAPLDLNGGMIANRNGEIIGLVMASKSSNYIIPVNYFKNIINSVLKDREIARPYFGVNYVDLDYTIANDLPAKSGAYIYGGGFLRSVDRKSPADLAGLQIGDVVLSIDEEVIGSHKNLGEIISEFNPGDVVKLKILREDEELDIDVVLGSE